jgi:hypothetical protein
MPGTEKAATALPPAGTRVVMSGANWFFWIAGLSLGNSLLFLVGGNTFMVIGLASSMYAQAFLQGVGTALAGQGSVISVAMGLFGALLITGVFAGLGLAARKRLGWAFLVGMVLYALDALVFLLLGDYLSVVFHLLALVMIFQGFRALGTVQKAQDATAAQAAVGDPALAQVSPAGAYEPSSAMQVPVQPPIEGPRESTAPPAFDAQPPEM